MQRFGKATVGLLTLMPMIWTAFCAVRIVQWWTGAPFDPDAVMIGGDAAKLTSEHFALAMKGAVGVAAVAVALLVAFLMHASSTTRIPQEQRGLWCAVLILGAGFTLPVYWWLYFWTDPAPRRGGLVTPPRMFAAPASAASVPAPEAPAAPLWQPS